MKLVKGIATAALAAATFVAGNIAVAADNNMMANDKVQCMVSSCKDLADCKTDEKGQNIAMMTKDECQKQGGTVMENNADTTKAAQ